MNQRQNSEEKERNKANGWGKTYVVYNKRLDVLGIHKGPKFIDFGSDGVHYWPHDIDHGGMTALVCDENFREHYAYVGEL